jgi:hypothetical protein
MKIKFIFLFVALFIGSTTFAQKVAPPKTVEQKQVPEKVTVAPAVAKVDTAASIPDTICVTVRGDTICLPTNDAVQAVEIIKELVTENKDTLPTNPIGWIMLVVGVFFSARGTVLVTAGKGMYNFLKPFLRKTLNIVAFVAGILSAGITFLLGKGAFDWQTFATIWGITSFLAVYIWETIKPEPVEPTA